MKIIDFYEKTKLLRKKFRVHLLPQMFLLNLYSKCQEWARLYF